VGVRAKKKSREKEVKKEADKGARVHERGRQAEKASQTGGKIKVWFTQRRCRLASLEHHPKLPWVFGSFGGSARIWKYPKVGGPAGVAARGWRSVTDRVEDVSWGQGKKRKTVVRKSGLGGGLRRAHSLSHPKIGGRRKSHRRGQRGRQTEGSHGMRAKMTGDVQALDALSKDRIPGNQR